MKADIGISYLRLSDEDINQGESESIINQRRFINDYCKRNGIVLPPIELWYNFYED